MRDLATPKLKAVVTRAIAKTGAWQGKKHKVTIRITLDPPGQDNRIRYQAVYHWKRISGLAGTVWDALETIQREARRLQREIEAEELKRQMEAQEKICNPSTA